MTLKIHRELFNQLRQHGERIYPQECCGILVGLVGPENCKTVHRIVPCANISAESLYTHYEISSVDLLRVQSEARTAGQQIVGFYHTHPDHPAHWSSTDLAEAHWTGCSYVITSVEKGKAAVTNSFLLLGEEHPPRFEDEPIELDDCSRR